MSFGVAIFWMRCIVYTAIYGCNTIYVTVQELRLPCNTPATEWRHAVALGASGASLRWHGVRRIPPPTKPIGAGRNLGLTPLTPKAICCRHFVAGETSVSKRTFVCGATAICGVEKLNTPQKRNFKTHASGYQNDQNQNRLALRDSSCRGGGCLRIR